MWIVGNVDSVPFEDTTLSTEEPEGWPYCVSEPQDLRGVSPGEFEVTVEAFSITGPDVEIPLTAFVGTADEQRIIGYSHQELIDTIVVENTSLTDTLSATDAVSLPPSVLPALLVLSNSGGPRQNL